MRLMSVMTEPTENLRILLEYQEELEKIRDEVKQGSCSTFKECLLLFEKLWEEDHPSNLLISNKARKKLEKIYHSDPKQHSHVVKKINQIQKKPEHYKPLSGDFYGSRRVHVGDFVLIYYLQDDQIVIMDYDHHKRVYE
jgi:addiction module RelE/StbE family toxin